jgi:hypothetical protein
LARLERAGGEPKAGRRGRAWIGALLIVPALNACDTPEQVRSPNWTGPRETPAGREYTPERAVRRNVAGWALLQCHAGPRQTSTGCVVLAEAPAGWGFGDSALRMSEGVSPRVASAGFSLPKEGGLFREPILFCPPDDTTCPARMRPEIAAFTASARLIEAQVRAGRCGEAKSAAAALGQPRFEAYLASWCATGRR